MPFRLKRVYDPPSAADGRRILIDRLWPRGLSKSRARLDDWLKEAAPSDGLRRWFGHDPKKWPLFKRRYFIELKNQPAVQTLRRLGRRRRVTLLFAARDLSFNNAAALREFLENRRQ